MRGGRAVASWTTNNTNVWGIITYPSSSVTCGTTTSDGWYITTGGTGTAVTAPTSWIVSNGTSNVIQVANGARSWYLPTTREEADETWNNWVVKANSVADALAWNSWVHQSNVRIEVRETREQAEARRRAEEQRLREFRAAEELRRKTAAEADIRAKKLLVENISAAQRKQLRERGHFDVNVKGKTYRIKWGSHGNVFLVHGDREVVSYCIQPPDVPVGDAMLAQKLMLETDEASFLRIANARELVRA